MSVWGAEDEETAVSFFWGWRGCPPGEPPQEEKSFLFLGSGAWRCAGRLLLSPAGPGGRRSPAQSAPATRARRAGRKPRAAGRWRLLSDQSSASALLLLAGRAARRRQTLRQQPAAASDR